MCLCYLAEQVKNSIFLSLLTALLDMQAWLLGAMAAANLLFMGFLYRSLRPANGALNQVSRKVSDTSASYTTDSTFSRNTSSGQDSLLESLSESHLQQKWKDCMLEPSGQAAASLTNGNSSPKQKASPQRASPMKSSPAKESPSKSSANGISGSSTPRTLDSAESEVDRQQQVQALTALADQRDSLSRDLKVSPRGTILYYALSICLVLLVEDCKSSSCQ